MCKHIFRLQVLKVSIIIIHALNFKFIYKNSSMHKTPQIAQSVLIYLWLQDSKFKNKSPDILNVGFATPAYNNTIYNANLMTDNDYRRGNWRYVFNLKDQWTVNFDSHFMAKWSANIYQEYQTPSLQLLMFPLL